jgi:polyhydroxyalkanoate synthesis regulator phasin
MQTESKPVLETLDTYYFEMFSKAGENACRSIVKKIIKKINGKKRVTQEEMTQYCSDLIKGVAAKHSEINDTEPEWHIADLTNKALAEVGYCFEVSRYDF